jgi:type II secretory pathway pseudopilin PulG
LTLAAPIRRAKPSEEGYILVSVMFLLALLIISMAVALPKVAADIQRDREIETYHRGLQYRRAIQLYYRKFNRYPPSLDALVKTNNIRFLRKRYIDPITKKDDWKPVMFGQNKAPLAMGFFGQPLGGMGLGGNVLAGIGPQGGNGMPGATPIGGPIGGLGAANPGIGATTGVGAAGSGVDPNGNPVDPNAAAGQNANPNDPNAPGGSQPFGGQTFGGAGIVGFSPASPKPSILVYKKKNHYNEWEFTYTPLSEMGLQGNMPQQPIMAGPGAPGTVQTPGAGPAPSPGPSPSPTPAPQQ